MKKHVQNALTLHELLIALAVLSILISLIPPSYGYLVEQSRAESIRNELIAFLNHARTQAIAERNTHVLCGSSNGEKCDGGWQHHWLLIRLKDQQLVRSFTPDRQYKLCWRGFGGQNVIFRANGMTSASNGSFTFCHNEMHWQLTLNRQGRLKKEDAEPGSACCQTDHTDS